VLLPALLATLVICSDLRRKSAAYDIDAAALGGCIDNELTAE